MLIINPINTPIQDHKIGTIRPCNAHQSFLIMMTIHNKDVINELQIIWFLSFASFLLMLLWSHFRLYHNNSNIIKKVISANQISFQIAIFVKRKKVRYEVKHEM